MEPGQLIFSLLSQAPAVAALLGSRIFPLRAPQNAPLPYATYQLVSRVPDGTPLCALGDVARVQLSLFSKTYAEVAALATAARRALDGYEAKPVYMQFDNEQDHHDDNAICFFRSQDYFVEVPGH